MAPPRKRPRVQDPQGPDTGAETTVVERPSLSSKLEVWDRLCAPRRWIRSVIRKGYALQFATPPPPFSGILWSQADEASEAVLREEITSLLGKGAIRRVEESARNEGFYHRYFIIPKKDGSMRPILDLRPLNVMLRKFPFKMLTLPALFKAIRLGDYFTSVDLKDAFFHITVVERHRKYLRFAFQDGAYEFGVLPFGLSLSPRTFSMCVDAALAPLRREGIRIFVYLDDALVAASSRQLVEEHTRRVTDHLLALGFLINWKKSCLTPSQTTVFLGIELNSTSMQATLSRDRRRRIRRTARSMQSAVTVSVHECAVMLGLMAAAWAALPLGLLHMRPLQIWFGRHKMPPGRYRHQRVPMTGQSRKALACWADPHWLSSGVQMGQVTFRRVMFTDASHLGWGAVCEGEAIRGVWGDQESRHINVLELEAVRLALPRLHHKLSNHHVLVRSDNTATVAYINRQGGVRSPSMNHLAEAIHRWAATHLLSIRAAHVPGRLNLGADLMSRGGTQGPEWHLKPEVVRQIWTRFGRADVDLFASRDATHCPLWFSIKNDSPPLGHDALAHPWPKSGSYAFPPFALIPCVLERVRSQRLQMVLVAPMWPTRIWYADLVALAQGPAWVLPLCKDLLSQAGGAILHPHPERCKLAVWSLSGTDC